jgi:PAS domain S-box-containing protein
LTKGAATAGKSFLLFTQNHLPMFKIISKALSFFRNGDTRTVYLNQDGSILSLNEKLAKKRGYNPSAVVGKSYSNLSADPLKDENYYKELLETANKRGVIKYTALTSENGKQRQTEIVLEVIRDESRAVIGYIATL